VNAIECNGHAAQVEQMLSTSHGLPGAKLAVKIFELELRKRASTLSVAKWQNEFSFVNVASFTQYRVFRAEVRIAP
jgi:hypothetical protein